MREEERFEVVLGELGALLSRIGWLCEVVLIGGQVLAIEQLASGEDALVRVETDTGQTIIRGYSFDPDLLLEPIDPEQSNRWDELPHLLREAGFRRTGRPFQWEKQVGEVYVRLDLFTPAGAVEAATPMTELPRGDAVLERAQLIRFLIGGRELAIRTPSPLDFVLMKLDATRIRRPPNAKDSFDLYAYVRKKGATAIGRALASALEREEALARLGELFGTDSSPGVLDVLSYATSLEDMERQLVARDVVRTFAEVRRGAKGE